MKFFKKNLYPFFSDNSASTKNYFRQQIISFIDKFNEDKAKIIELIERNLKQQIKKLVCNPRKKVINIMITKYQLSNPCKLTHKATLFFDFNIELIQFINDCSIYLFVFRHNTEYFIYKYIDNDHYQAIRKYKKKPEIAFGSSHKNIVISVNSYKSIEVNSIDDLKFYTTPYENSSKIKYPNYVVKFNCLLYINDKNQAMSYNFWKNVVTRLNIKEKIISLRISENQELIGVGLEFSIKILNLNLETYFEIQTTSIKFYIANSDLNSFTLYYYDENSIRIEFFSKEKDNYAFYPQITGIAFEISNILSVTLKDTRKIYIQSEIQEELDFAIKFYEGLKEFSKNHIIIKYTENLIRESSFLSELSQECLKKLSYLHYIPIAHFENSNLNPKFKNPRNLIFDLKNSNLELFNLVTSLSDFEEIESLLLKVPKIKVISLVADKYWFINFNMVFKKNYYVNYRSSIYANINEINNEFYLCLYSPFSSDLIELQKVISFFNSISHHLLIAPPKNFNSLHLYKCLKLSRIRFPEITLEPDSIQILLMKNLKDFFILDAFKINYFTETNIEDEMRYLIESFSLEKKPKDTLELMIILKGALISLYLDDDVSIFDRLAGIPNDIELIKTLVSNDNGCYLESFQINKNPFSARCKSVCPGCSAMCELLAKHKSNHYTRIHRTYKNRYNLDFENIIISTCELCCHENSHYHYEPCVGVCKSGKKQFATKWKHKNKSKKFNMTNIEYIYDKIECKIWWAYNEWSLATTSLN